MNLYLVRHAEAKPESEDPERPLSEIGHANIEKVATYCSANKNIKVKVILHSGKKRAQQTADIFAGYVNPVSGVLKANNLRPNNDTTVWLDRLSLMEQDLMLVGHLPHLQLLSSELLYGDPNHPGVDFLPATTACIKRDDSGNWSLEWVVTPPTVPD